MGGPARSKARYRETTNDLMVEGPGVPVPSTPRTSKVCVPGVSGAGGLSELEPEHAAYRRASCRHWKRTAYCASKPKLGRGPDCEPCFGQPPSWRWYRPLRPG
jgi:hypothetical protein